MEMHIEELNKLCRVDLAIRTIDVAICPLFQLIYKYEYPFKGVIKITAEEGIKVR